MGYYTQYELSIQRGPDDLIKELRAEYEGANYAFDDDGVSQDMCKWYDHEKDLKAFSIKHPQALFKLEGVGEESGDNWQLYVQDGLCQRCVGRIVFDEFDYDKLLADIRESKIDKIVK